jgi:hypothetical protein
MSHRRDHELERRLRELRAPDEAEAEERSLDVVRAAYADHVPLRPSRGTRRIGVAVACGAAALAIGLSPAGAKVGDFVSDVFSPSPGEPNAKPELRSLPAPGQLLVESAQGPWVVQEDGSKRLLGNYGYAVWSPHGRFVAATNGHELVALAPDGTVRWTIGAPGRIAQPRWSLCCDEPFPYYRIAYLSGDDLRVVDADGSDDRLVASRVAPLAPAWRPGADGHVLTYLDRFKRTHTVDVDSGATTVAHPGDADALFAAAVERRAISPDGSAVASLESSHGRDRLVLEREGGSESRLLFAARGHLTGPTWSPDGRWLLVGWPKADQWLFIPVNRHDDPVAIGRISEQFTPGAPDSGAFPRVLGWAPEPPTG